MTTLEAFLFGLIQGLTEFLPVSSSGHLELLQYFLGYRSLHSYILFNLVCHLGTLGAIFYFFAPQIKQLFKLPSPLMVKLALGILPLFPLLLIMKPIKSLFDQPEILGYCFLITAALIFASLSIRLPLPANIKQRRWTDPLTIGLFQSIAIIPGISRSGATISAARMLGWGKEEAIQFSFLLAIPTILGGAAIEFWQFWRSSSAAPSIGFLQFAVGFITSFFVGCFALKLLERLIVQNKWQYFAWYCLILGLAAISYFHYSQ